MRSRFRLWLRGTRRIRLRWRLLGMRSRALAPGEARPLRRQRWADFRDRSLRLLNERGWQPLRAHGRRSRYALAHLVTSANLTAGVASILFSAGGNPVLGAWLVFVSMLFDAIDGRVARWMGASGDFGRELDSLADVVSFGVAPALALSVASGAAHPLFAGSAASQLSLGWLAVTLFAVAGALRLARFNLIRTSGAFIGLPIPAAGGILAGLAIYGARGPLLPYVMFALGYLMISNFRYPDFKSRLTHEQRQRLWPAALPVAIGAVVIGALPRTIAFVPLVVYASVGPLLSFTRWLGERFTRSRRRPKPQADVD